jgi:hypothetical protein
MDSIKINGMVHTIQSEQIISDKYKKREMFVEITGKFPQTIAVQFSNDKCDLCNNVKIGDQVEISINLRGRLWTDPKTGIKKCFNTLEGWSMHLTQPVHGTFASSSQPSESAPLPQPNATAPQQTILDNPEDDLPF